VLQQTDVDRALLHPNVFLASDGLRSGMEGHPRAAGTFPRFLAQYVRTGRISLYSAIEKISTLPAKKLGLRTKGHLGIGADADIAIFRLENIQDNASFTEPTLPASGMDWVLIRGEIALKNDRIVRQDIGRALRK
jgi:N-acyl-D-amino-acid deacylase